MKDKHVIQYLEHHLCLISRAAKEIGCTPYMLRKRIKNTPRLRDWVQEYEQEMLDLGESTLLKAMRRGEIRAAIYYLNAKGKSRGYGRQDKMEIIATVNQPSAKTLPDSVTDATIEAILAKTLPGVAAAQGKQ